ncbi:WbuC family cupin fold metalloprotein [Synechococcus sp. A15-24]|uniref:WbuC family cupin fold metalloprotein n=1 Tax=Synechococcus sp. A15-24 TaxID=1050635 RepID=UPI0016488A42|nr:WbuC family cupin fold metalloprotein [Synechococcus sp. A15-24]
MKKIAEGVFHVTGPILCLTDEMIDALLVECSSASKKRARINFHPSNKSNVQEMIVALHKSTQIDPHRHLNKSESFHVIQGDVSVAILKEETFEPVQLIHLSAGSSHCYYRLNEPLYHLVVPMTEFVVMHETTEGPFIPSSHDDIHGFDSDARLPVESIKILICQDYNNDCKAHSM